MAAGQGSWRMSIDFGTSFSVAAVVGDSDGARILEVDGESRLPSVVLIDGDEIVVGRVADELGGGRPSDVLRAPKTRLGDQAPVILAGRTFRVGTLVAALLRRIHDEAVIQFGSRPADVRLTYPATWTRTKQSRLLDAASEAGIVDTILVPEPVAAALAYWNRGELAIGDHIAVYDLGGGTFDSAVLRSAEDGFQIIGRPDGDASLGGELFDELLVNVIGERLDADVWEQIQLADTPSWQLVAGALRREARRVKETLSNYARVDALVPLPTGLTRVPLTRDDFDAVVSPYTDDAAAILRRCIREAGLEPDQLAGIQLVGGSSRVPAVEASLRREFPGIAMVRRGDPKSSVALGALLATPGDATPLPTRFGSSEERRPHSQPSSPPPAGPAPSASVPPVVLQPPGPVSVPPMPAPVAVPAAAPPPVRPPAPTPPALTSPLGPASPPRAGAPPAATSVDPLLGVGQLPPPRPPGAGGPGAASGWSRQRKARVGTFAAAALAVVGVGAAILVSRDSDSSRKSADTTVATTDESVIESQSTAESVTPSSTDPASSGSVVTETAAPVEPAADPAASIPTGQMQMTIDIDPAAVWDDGSPITVADFHCTWQAYTNSIYFSDGYGQISSVEAGASDHQVVVAFDALDGGYRSLFNGLVQASEFSDCDDISASLQSSLPFSGRAWKLESWSETEEVLVPNPAYWGADKATVSRIRIVNQNLDADGEINSLASGAVDAIFPRYYLGVQDQLAGVAAGTAVAYGEEFEALYFQSESGPFADPAYRSAFLLSIDSDALLNHVYAGFPLANGRLHCGPAVPGPFCPSDAFPNYFNPAGAESTLVAAGYERNADGLWAKNGEVPHVRWLINSGNTRRENAQEYLIPLLVDAGFDVAADNCDSACVFQQRLPSLDYDMTMFINSPAPEHTTLSAQYSCDQIPSDANGYAGQNTAGFCDQSVSDLLARADVTTDRAARIDLIHQAIRGIDAANVMIPMYQFPTFGAWSPDVGNIANALSNYRRFDDLFAWIDADGDGEIVIGAEDYPTCLNPATDCPISVWYSWIVSELILPSVWDTTNEGLYEITELVTGEPVVVIGTG